MGKTNYRKDIYEPMTTAHYANGGWYSVDGRKLTLDEALSQRGDHMIVYANAPAVFKGVQVRNMLKSYPPSLWAHGGRVRIDGTA